MRAAIGLLAVLTAAVTASLGGCAAQSSEKPTMALPDTIAVRAAVQKRETAFGAAVLSGNVDSIASYVTDDIIQLEPGVDVHSSAALRELLGRMLQTTAIVDFTMTPEGYVY